MAGTPPPRISASRQDDRQQRQGGLGDGDAEITAALGLAGLGRDGETNRSARSSVVNGTPRVVVTGKRRAESSEDEEEDSEEDGDRGVKRKRARVASGSEGSRAINLLDTGKSVGRTGATQSSPQGMQRRRFYFEDYYSSSDSEEEDEPTALLTLKRQKEAANAARRMKNAAAKDPSIVLEPGKGSRGKSKPVVNDPYRELLNEMITDARARRVYPAITFRPSDVDGVKWSGVEKERFFRALPRLGRHNPVALAEEVKTKSVVEVQGYLSILKKELNTRVESNQSSRYALLMGEDIPAAVEVSEDCEAALKEEADRLAGYVQKLDEKERKWGADEAVVDFEMATNMAADRLETSEDNELFDLVNWFNIAGRIFGLPAHEQKLGNFAIHKQTLEDLKALITSITRRVVSIIIFQAQSRLKNTQTSLDKSNKPLEIGIRDIVAAIKMLGMPTTSEEYWRQIPRRLQLKVFRHDLGVEKGLMEYDDVEKEMKTHQDTEFYLESMEERRKGKETEVTESWGWETDEEEEVNDHVEEDQSEDSSQNESESGDDIAESSEEEEAEGSKKPRDKNKPVKYIDASIDLQTFLHDRPPWPLKPRQIQDIVDELQFIDRDERYINAVDKFHSKLEEKKLWKVLGGWKERKQRLENKIKKAERKIPREPNLKAFRRLEKWKRDEWRNEAGTMVPIWRQRYYRKLWDQEKVVRIKKKGRSSKGKKKLENGDDMEIDGEDEELESDREDKGSDNSSDSDSDEESNAKESDDSEEDTSE